MLKRHQVLLTDWQTDYLRKVAENHDISFSEAIRLMVSLYAGQLAQAFDPEYKFPFTPEKIRQTMCNQVVGKISEEDMHKLISQIYFESRKAIEHIEVKHQQKAGK